MQKLESLKLAGHEASGSSLHDLAKNKGKRWKREIHFVMEGWKLCHSHIQKYCRIVGLYSSVHVTFAK